MQIIACHILPSVIGEMIPFNHTPFWGYVGITEGSTEVCISNLTEKCVNLKIKQGFGNFSGSY